MFFKKGDKIKCRVKSNYHIFFDQIYEAFNDSWKEDGYELIQLSEFPDHVYSVWDFIKIQ